VQLAILQQTPPPTLRSKPVYDFRRQPVHRVLFGMCVVVVRAHTGAWIETCVDATGIGAQLAFAPTRARGLKLLLPAPSLVWEVRAHTGAWIET
jgi:hypothetical protein